MTRPIDLVVIHCSATPPDMDIGVSQIRRWHVNERGFADVGYHYVIRRDGKIEIGRPLEQIGAHVKGHNEKSIGICLIGGTNADDRREAEFNFTMPQMMWLADLLNKLTQDYPAARLCGHRDLDPHKACPAFSVRHWWGGDRLGKMA